jgi:preprotein translocase subunit SecB
MSDTNQPQPAVGQAPITIHGQYIKDLSFENPRAPQSLQLTAPPQYSLNVRCDARNLEQPGMFEVTMSVELDGKDPQGQQIFVMELVYAGVVSVGAVPQEAIGPIIGIHVPMLLFPFARSIVADVLGQAALPPLLLQPVDFAALYQQQMTQASNAPVGHA